MGKDLKGKEIGAGIVQQPNGTYFARFVDKFGKRRTKRSKKLQEVKQWLADATYIDQHSDLDQVTDMADEGYKTTTIYQTRIALYNMFEFARENDVLIANPCKK